MPPKPGSSRLFAIGDIHGCARELSALLAEIRPGVDDTVVCLGDYIDRGPDSKRVIDLLLNLSKKTNLVCLKGNHEAMFLDFLENPEAPGAGMFVINGGSATLASYSGPDGAWMFPEDHIDFFKNLRTHFETDTHFFVHAGVPATPLTEIDFRSPEVQNCLMWTRQPFLSTPFRWDKIIVHGHTPVSVVDRQANRINLDTGCVFGNTLTALELPSGKIHSVARGVMHTIGLLPIDPARISRRFSGQLPVLASKPGETERSYETLNYNQFGLLMRDLHAGRVESVLAGDSISGEIGANSSGTETVKFVGHVVRTDTRGEHVMYAIRIDKISGGVWGPDWIERP